MENIFSANSIKIQFLHPLVKWKILDLSSLIELAEIPTNYWSLQKLIRRFEMAQIVKSYRDPWNGKKYVYLGDLGRKLIGERDLSNASQETLLHDAKVTEIVRELLKRNCFHKSKLEHDLIKRRNFTSEITPDAILEGERTGVRFRLALELEITRKSFERIASKIRNYLTSSEIDYVLYLFCNKKLFDTYKKYIFEAFDGRVGNQIMLFWNSTILTKTMNLSRGMGEFNSKEVSFDELFQ